MGATYYQKMNSHSQQRVEASIRRYKYRTLPQIQKEIIELEHGITMEGECILDIEIVGDF